MHWSATTSRDTWTSMHPPWVRISRRAWRRIPTFETRSIRCETGMAVRPSTRSVKSRWPSSIRIMPLPISESDGKLRAIDTRGWDESSWGLPGKATRGWSPPSRNSRHTISVRSSHRMLVDTIDERAAFEQVRTGFLRRGIPERKVRSWRAGRRMGKNGRQLVELGSWPNSLSRPQANWPAISTPKYAAANLREQSQKKFRSDEPRTTQSGAALLNAPRRTPVAD